jgi:hypothetical protein
LRDGMSLCVVLGVLGGETCSKLFPDSRQTLQPCRSVQSVKSVSKIVDADRA